MRCDHCQSAEAIFQVKRIEVLQEGGISLCEVCARNNWRNLIEIIEKRPGNFPEPAPNPQEPKLIKPTVAGDRITPAEADELRKHRRFAVVVFHGIGEQKPMDTLRNFVNALLPEQADDAKDKSPRFFSKPDRISDQFDLRRINITPSDSFDGDETDVYELYWAHLMERSTLAQIGAWISLLLLRKPTTVPKRLLPVWCLSWALILGIAVLSAVLTRQGSSLNGLFGAGLAGGAVWIAIRCLRTFAIGYAADAARYLRPAPENIAVRQQIRNLGLTTLKTLHEEPGQRYDRIIVVGHSLGCVIAYDVLTHLWQQMHWQHVKPRNPDQPCYEEMKSWNWTRCKDEGGHDAFRKLQSRLLREEQVLGMPWKITDFITLGSPLTYAEFLMANKRYPLEERILDRELPICPPAAIRDGEEAYHLTRRYKLADGSEGSKKILHHGALFACTRWTNIYFEADSIGGEVGSVFGNGIEDVKLETNAWFRPASHIRYWHTAEESACRALRKALALNEARNPQE